MLTVLAMGFPPPEEAKTTLEVTSGLNLFGGDYTQDDEVLIYFLCVKQLKTFLGTSD